MGAQAVPAVAQGAARTYRHIATLADGEGRFERDLVAVAVAPGSRLVAVGDREVRLFARDGALAARWATELAPSAVAVDRAGRVLVGEQGQVEVFDDQGRRLRALRDPLRLGRVTALAAVGAEGADLLVADATARRLRRYDPRGAHVADIGHDNRMKGFLIPNGALDFALDADGVIHAANPGKHRVERYAADGALFGHFGRFDGRDPAGFAGCCNPTNVALGPKGRVFVTEKAPPRVKVYDREGRLEAVVAADGFDLGCKNMDVAVDDDGRVFVVDTVRRVVRVFAPPDAPGAPQARGREDGDDR